MVNSTLWSFTDYLVKLLVGNSGSLNVLLVKDSRDVERLQKMPLLCDFYYIFSLREFLFNMPGGLTKKPYHGSNDFT